MSSNLRPLGQKENSHTLCDCLFLVIHRSDRLLRLCLAYCTLNINVSRLFAKNDSLNRFLNAKTLRVRISALWGKKENSHTLCDCLFLVIHRRFEIEKSTFMRFYKMLQSLIYQQFQLSNILRPFIKTNQFSRK